jgi:hypothetical protein
MPHTIKRRRVRRIAKRPEDEHVLQAKLVGKYSEERATEDHDTECQSIGAIHEVWLLLPTCADICDCQLNRQVTTVVGSLLLSAFQMPGCVKLIIPTTTTLKRGLLYQRVNRDTGLPKSSLAFSVSGSSTFDDIVHISKEQRTAPTPLG